MLNQQSFDTRRRFAHFELNMLPGNWISPYAAYDTDSGSGTGVTTYVANSNEYPVPTTLRDRTDNFEEEFISSYGDSMPLWNREALGITATRQCIRRAA